MATRGALIIYDNSGVIWVNTGDAVGDILPHVYPDGLPYKETLFGELDGKKVLGVDVPSGNLILEDLPLSYVQKLEQTIAIDRGIPIDSVSEVVTGKAAV